jgi:hypothetical protein
MRDRDRDRDGLLRPMHSHSATPRSLAGVDPSTNSTNRSPTGQLDPFERPQPAAPDPLVTHHDRRRSTCDALH